MKYRLYKLPQESTTAQGWGHSIRRRWLMYVMTGARNESMGCSSLSPLYQENIHVIALRNISLTVGRKSTSWCPKCHPGCSSHMKESSPSPQREGTAAGASLHSPWFWKDLFVILPKTECVTSSSQVPEIANDKLLSTYLPQVKEIVQVIANRYFTAFWVENKNGLCLKTPVTYVSQFWTFHSPSFKSTY